jgi:hypothetical protein
MTALQIASLGRKTWLAAAAAAAAALALSATGTSSSSDGQHCRLQSEHAVLLLCSLQVGAVDCKPKHLLFAS